MSSQTATSPTKSYLTRNDDTELPKCRAGRKTQTLTRGQEIECKWPLSWWVHLLNQTPNEKMLSPLQATLQTAKALAIKGVSLLNFF